MPAQLSFKVLLTSAGCLILVVVVAALGWGTFAPNTIATLALCAISLILMSAPIRRPRTMKALAAFILTMGLLGVGTQAGGVKSVFSWGKNSMSLAAGLGFIGIGVAQMMWAVAQAKKQGRHNVWSFPFSNTETRDRKFQFLANVIPQIIWTATPDGNIDYYNQRWYDYTGLTFEQTKGWGWQPVVHPEDLQICVEKWAAAYSTGADYEVECRFKRASDGAYRWHLGRAFPQRDDLGNIIEWFGTCTDIHEQKLAAERLEQRAVVRTSELAVAAERLKLATSAAGIAIWDWSVKEGTIVWDRAMFEIYGLEPTQSGVVSYRDWADNVFPEDFPLQQQRLATLAENGGHDAREFRIIRVRDKSVRIIQAAEVSIPGEDHKPARIVGVNIDVTDQRSAVQALGESEQRFRSTFEYAGTGMAIVALDGRLVRVNKLLCEIVGYSEEVLLQKTFQDITHPDDLSDDLANVQKLIDGELQFYRMEKRYIHREGFPVWIRLTASVVRHRSNEAAYFVAQVEDISVRKQLESKLAESLNAAVDASRLKSEFLANMSHEIRTPMNGIIGMTALLLDTPLSADQQDMARVVQNSSESLLSIINDILDFSKIEAGKLSIEAKPYDLRQLVDETLAILAPRAHEKGLELINDFDLELPPGMIGDSGRIRQILTNLVGNAIKFTSQGEVVVTTKQGRLSREQVGFRIEVKDTGIGIPEKAQAMLFKPFEQGDASTTRKFGGTGLGLAISRQLIDLMEGAMGFESVQGTGSTFWFDLDFPRALNIFSETMTPFAPGRRVLVVDDNATSRRILTANLSKLGFLTESASNASEAITLLLQKGPASAFNLALLDWEMPGIDGMQLAREIRQNPRYAHLPIIMLSSTVGDSSDLHGLNAQTLIKPARTVQLRRAIAEALSSSPVDQTASNFIPRSPQKCRILLADDNPTNQLVGRLLLEKMGHQVTVVDDGLKVIEILKNESFDVVFMDCQMPQLDGYEATRRIRSGECGEAAAKVTIVALTAYAMATDRSKCLEAGMDDYISKPMRVEDVSRVLLRVLVVKTETVPSIPWDGTAIPFDRTPLAQFDGMMHEGMPVVLKLIELFERNEPRRLAAMKAAVEERSATKLSIEAHAMAGSCGSLGGREVRARAHTIEHAASQEDWVSLASKVSGLEAALTRFHAELKRFVA